MIRYKLTTDSKYIYLSEQARADNPETVVNITQEWCPIFVNILPYADEHRNNYLSKVKAFLSDGRVIDGFVLRDYIELHFIGDVFDGRFNI